MLRYRLYLKIFFLLTICWLIVSVLFGTFKSINDGYNEIGFPFTFYRSFSGKCFDCKEVGFLWKGFLLDVAIVLVIAFIVRITVQKKQSSH